MSRDPLTIVDFQKGWKKLMEEEDQQKLMPVHPLASVRATQGFETFCKFCHRGYTKGTESGRIFRYSNLCFGKRRWWFFGRWMCPKVPHFHVKCRNCDITWFEGMNEE